MSVREEGTYGLLIPQWEGYQQDVYNFDKQANNANDTDKGKLKGLLKEQTMILQQSRVWQNIIVPWMRISRSRITITSI